VGHWTKDSVCVYRLINTGRLVIAAASAAQCLEQKTQ